MDLQLPTQSILLDNKGTEQVMADLEEILDLVAGEVDHVGPATPLRVKLKGIAAPCHLADQDKPNVRSCTKQTTNTVKSYLRIPITCAQSPLWHSS